MNDDTTDGRDELDGPSQYGDGGAVAYDSDGNPVALLFAGGGGWSFPVDDPPSDKDLESVDE